MKISKLIKELQDVQDKHGNLKIHYVQKVTSVKKGAKSRVAGFPIQVYAVGEPSGSDSNIKAKNRLQIVFADF